MISHLYGIRIFSGSHTHHPPTHLFTCYTCHIWREWRRPGRCAAHGGFTCHNVLGDYEGMLVAKLTHGSIPILHIFIIKFMKVTELCW